MNEWHVIVVEGHARELRAFVSGFVTDRGLDPAIVVFGDDVGLEPESLVARLRTLVRGGHHAILLPADQADSLGESLGRGGAALGLRVTDRHPVARASFAFAAEAFSREVSAAVRAVCRTLPAGVHFEAHAESEEARAENAGVELYTPVHHYAYRVRATAAGPLGGILDVRRRLGEIEAVVVEPLRLA